MASRTLEITFIGNPKSLQDAMDKVGDSAEKLNKKVDGTSDKLANVGKTAGLVAAGGLAALGGGLALSISTAANFEQAVDQIGAVAGATSEEMKGLSDAALRIGKDTAFSATEAAGAMEVLAANGISARDIMDGAADATVALAAAGGTDLKMAADVASTAMSVWGIKASEMSEVVNRLAGAANVSRFGVEDMSLAVAQGGGAAKLAGVEFGDFTTIIAATASSFNSGADAGTSFKTFLNGLTPSTKSAAAAFDELGLFAKDGSNRFFDAKGNLKSMAEVTQILHDATKDLTEEQKSQYLTTIFGTDAMRMAGAVSALTGDQIAGMSEKMRTTDAAAVAAQRMGNFKGSMEALKGSIETIEIEIGLRFLPVLTKLANFAAEELPKAFDWFEQEAAPAIGAAAGAIVAALEPVGAFVEEKILPPLERVAAWFVGNKEALIAAGAAISAVLVVAFGAWAVSAGAAAVATLAAAAPVIAILAAVALLAAGIVLLVRNWDEITQKFPLAGQALDQVKEKFNALVEWLKSKFLPDAQMVMDAVITAVKKVVDFVRDHWDEIRAVIEPQLQALGVIVKTAWGLIQNEIETALGVIKGIVNVFMGVFTGDWDRAWQGVKQIVGSIWDGIKGTIENAIGLIKGLAPLILEAGQALGEALFDGLKSALSATAGFAGDVGSAVLGAVKSVINSQVIDRLNSVLEFSFDTHIPGVGSISIDPPDIPHLARGGIVIAGDNPSGIEAIVPLERAREFGFGNGGGAQVTINVTGPVYAAEDGGRAFFGDMGYAMVNRLRAQGAA